MHANGFVAAGILLIVFLCLLSVYAMRVHTNQTRTHLASALLSLENASFERTVLEHNTDYLMKRVLFEESRVPEPATLHLRWSTRMFYLLKRLQTQYRGLNWQVVTVSPHAGQHISPATPTQPFSLLQLMTLSVSWKEQLTPQQAISRVAFTGGAWQTQAIAARWPNAVSSPYFLIPVHYRQEVWS